VKAVFVEMPAFTRYRSTYLSDATFFALQQLLLNNPDAGALVPGAGGLRKLRFAEVERNKGKRGGIRVIYFWWQEGRQFWLFTLYGKSEMSNLSAQQTSALKKMIKTELSARQKLK
jgi:hypothetical protein